MITVKITKISNFSTDDGFKLDVTILAPRIYRLFLGIRRRVNNTLNRRKVPGTEEPFGSRLCFRAPATAAADCVRK